MGVSCNCYMSTLLKCMLGGGGGGSCVGRCSGDGSSGGGVDVVVVGW